MKIKVIGAGSSSDWRNFKKNVDEIVDYCKYRGFNHTGLVQLDGPNSATIDIFASGFYLDDDGNDKFLKELRLCFPNLKIDFS